MYSRNKRFLAPLRQGRILLPLIFLLALPSTSLLSEGERPESRRIYRDKGGAEVGRERRKQKRERDEKAEEGERNERKKRRGDEEEREGRVEEGRKEGKHREEGGRGKREREREGEEQEEEIDPDNLPALIREAMERGRENLLNSFPRHPPGNYSMGRMALPLAALLRAGLPSNHEAIAEGFETLETLPLKEVYSVACYLMALDALILATAREIRQADPKKSHQPVIRRREQVKGPVQNKMKRLIDWLLSVRNRGRGTWHYRGEGGHDFSNTQFAILGLQVGLEHGIPISRDIFQEIARQFSNQLRERAKVEFTITYNLQLKSFLTGTAAPIKNYYQPVGGWGYTANERIPYGSMTAAGASNLLVARGGLGGVLSREAQESLECALGWIAMNFDQFLHGNRYYYYTLYSLEKVGDIGDIAAFNGHDWYEEGAIELIRRQKADGSWGDYVDTSFALLFLTRATRPAMRALPAPRVTTQAGGDDAQKGDRVYIDSIDGFISAREFFEYLVATGDAELLKIAREAAHNYPLARQAELVPWILPLWSNPNRAFRTFARKALEDATGEDYENPEDYERWHDVYLAIQAAEGSQEKNPETVAKLLREAPGLRLKNRLVELISREKLIACGPALIREIQSPDLAYSKRVSEILERLVAKSPHGLVLERAGDQTGAAAAWRAFWFEEGERLVAGERVRKLIALLESEEAKSHDTSGGQEGVKKVVDSLVQEGRTAIPFILEAMAQPEFSAHLVIALEQISGKRLGLRLGRWRDWWEQERE